MTTQKRKLNSTRHQEVDLSMMVPHNSLGKYIGWFFEGVSNGVDPGLFCRLLFSNKGWFVFSLLMFLSTMSLPMLAVGYLLEYFSLNGYDMAWQTATLLLISVPLSYVWQDRLFTISYEAAHNVIGAGTWDYRTYMDHKYSTVQTDCLMLFTLLVGWAGVRLVAELTANDVVMAVVEAVAVVCESLTFSYIAHTSRFDRMKVNTRGLKSKFIDTRLPYFVGFSIPSTLLLKWLATRSPVSTPIVQAVLLAISTISASSVRPDGMGRPHPSSQIFSIPHTLVSLFFPSASGCGIS